MLRIQSVHENTHRYDAAVHKYRKMAARMSRPLAVEQKRYAAGMEDTQG